MTSQILELDEPGFNALVHRVTEASEHGLALSAEDTRLLLDALLTLATLQDRLNDRDITVHKLKKLLGIVNASEKLRDLIQATDSAVSGKGSRSGSNRKRRKKPASPPVKPVVEHHRLENLRKGDTCPECERGTLTKQEPARLLRVTGSTPFTSTLHLSERLRCNTCGMYFTAELPKDVRADGGSDQKYGFSARSLIAINKYFAGSPYYRQESLQAILGMPVPASSAFDQCEHLSNDLHPLFRYLKQLAADAGHFHMDDTGHRILEQKPVKKKPRNGGGERMRSGVYSSGMIARLKGGQEIILFQTDIGHAGEFLDDILQRRTPESPPPIVMSDALSSNHVSAKDFVKSLCNSHGRRQYADVMTHFPEEVAWVLEQYKHIWMHESESHKQTHSPTERRDWHRAHSLPVMEGIRQWGKDQLASQVVEENCGLGKAIRYFEHHYEGLTQFCVTPGAQIDNNIMEQQIKLVVRNRKNAGFFKTLVGAGVGDILTSMIATTASAGANLFEYFTIIQSHRQQVRDKPELWLPWNYQKQL